MEDLPEKTSHYGDRIGFLTHNLLCFAMLCLSQKKLRKKNGVFESYQYFSVSPVRRTQV
jgi:hypothetical protein